MASDNKINTTNSWDLALIDYFYDLSLLREKGGINFQKASATLDGCVKIYSSRVDSAATETGRLLNGLATGRTRKSGSNGEDDEDEDGEDDVDVDLNAPTKQRKNRVTSNKDTLVEFEAISIKKMDFEVHVDPLFKKVLTDFDEGGSKSLLINMLSVDKNQKIIFDTTEASTESKGKLRRNSILNELNDNDKEVNQSLVEMDIDEEDLNGSNEIDITSLGEKYFSGSSFTDLMVCSSIKDIYAVLNQEATPTTVLQILEKANLHDYYTLSESNQQPDDWNYDVSLGGDFDEPENPNNSKYPGNKSSIFFDDLAEDTDHYGTTIRELFNTSKSFAAIHEEDEEEQSFAGDITNVPDENLLAYFDQNLRNNWAGPDHWKVKKLKSILNLKNKNITVDSEDSDQQLKQKIKKKEKAEPFAVDFLSDEYPDEDIIFEPAYNINLPKKHWESNDHHVLPVDMHYTTRYFINLFQKDILINSAFKKAKNLDEVINESLYAGISEENTEPPVNLNHPDFFHDDNNDDGDQGFDISFGDGFDDDNAPTATQSSQLPIRPSQNGGLNYSRVSKKVDIKLLKDNIWDTLSSEASTRKSIVHTESSIATTDESSAEDALKFSDIVHGVTRKYTEEKKKDLSTSFCFICLLHLANENGFTIENNSDNSDLVINTLTV